MAQLTTSAGPCPYFSDRNSVTEFMVTGNISPKEVEQLLSEGFRHFGRFFFRPACSGCRLCIPYRVDLRNFTYRKWQRRILRNDLRICYDTPDIYNAFKLYKMHKEKFPDDHEEPVIEDYYSSFYSPMESLRHLSIYDSNNTLVAVSHYDSLPNSASAIYTYYDYKNYAACSPGSLAVLSILNETMEDQKEYLYLGYYIPGHPHMDYKKRYKPSEILSSGGNWIPFSKHDIVPV